MWTIAKSNRPRPVTAITCFAPTDDRRYRTSQVTKVGCDHRSRRCSNAVCRDTIFTLRGLPVILLLAGCDRLFGLVDVSNDEIGSDASAFDAIALDTAGWPTDGGVDPRPCSGTAPDEDGDMI